MRFLLIFGLALILNSIQVRAIDTPRPLKCAIDTQQVCSSNGCKANKSSVWLELDFSKMTYKRCDSKGCDTYDFEGGAAGDFVIIRHKANNGSFFKMDQAGKFMEVSSAMLSSYVSFGTCKSL